ncbi:MAG TPA: hypothetical protein VE690_01670, partial [Rhodopila sp.]|nr:hypothetical protein [Rhodopila sp.]
PGARVLIPSASLGGTISADASTGALESSIAQVRRFYPKAEVVEQSAATLVKRGALQSGRSAVLTYRELNHGQERPMKLEIYSFCCAGGRWNYEYRFRYPDGVQDPAAIAAFLRESSWTAAR